MIKISKTTILPMLDIMERFNAGVDVRKDLSELLEYEDYQIEIERYQNHIEGIGFTKEEYIDYFLNIRTVEVETIASKALKYRVKDLLSVMDNVDYYRDLYEEIKDFKEADVKDALIRTRFGLPDEIELDDIRIIFSIGLGLSGGWVYKNNSHYDLKLIIDKEKKTGLKNTIAHECHHIGFNKYMKAVNMDALSSSKDTALVLYFSGEGTAIKYCNNFHGIMTRKIYKHDDMDIDDQSYRYYLNNFDKIYDGFRNDIVTLRSCDKKEMNVVRDIFMKNYFYRDVVIDGELRENYLWQPIAYHLGADIWGLVHDVFGREKVFDLLMNPSSFFQYFNMALSEIDRDDLHI
ncbi:DUF5700 domain-containing putative Zn-dependent protease [Vallitalea okinawensis]|uniref:DUF5700 domain-containing putative Zn-dependent protease n=1 Tax=Vallitalea okinawensis TaxID=2078660 RepID=UPI000CFBE0C9|nr:DUF5700 domain-containing putative Zn-dependent protease [Vallitalea okinawensis]